MIKMIILEVIVKIISKDNSNEEVVLDLPSSNDDNDKSY